MFIKNEACSITNCEPGVTRKVMGYNDDVMMCEITFEEGAKGNVSKGDCVLMPPGAEHGTVCLEAGKLVDVFQPIRDDFI